MVSLEFLHATGMLAGSVANSSRLIIQQVLETVAKYVYQIAQKFPNGLEVLPKIGGFPRIRILQASAGNELLKCVAQEICKSGLPGLPIWNVSPY